MLPAWLPWIAAPVVTLVLAVVLRLLAGDEPDNTITQEQGDDQHRTGMSLLGWS